MVEKLSGLDHSWAHRNQKAGNTPLMNRLAETNRLVLRVGQGIGREPACCQCSAQSMIPVLRWMQETTLWDTGEHTLVGG